MSHNHHHHHHQSNNLTFAFLLNLSFTIIEFIGGLLTNSVAILSDAIHDLGDSFALGFAVYLQKKSEKLEDEQFTFGYRRFSLLGALLNSIILIVGSLFIMVEAFERVLDPEATYAPGMLAFAILGILVNGWAVLKLRSGKTLNERVVTWHLLEDVLGWVAVFIVSIVLLFTDLYILDPILSILITAYVLFNVLKRLKETLFIFLQGVPDDIQRDAIEERITTLDGVHSVHHTHLWTLDGEHHVLSTHAVLNEIDSLEEYHSIKNQIKEQLEPYHFSHLTLELELPKESCPYNPLEAQA